eukprot:TRINITY_DN5508_c0_g1_i4.p1 TRINITY_DN5508_c0_g1~~TRINITY_DN5508_c0_g1_i4.p1  ORF type:complete len:1482 (-),score=512.19 TRINITY_DN5508_c0_g1_i4:32-3964(-)
MITLAPNQPSLVQYEDFATTPRSGNTYDAIEPSQFDSAAYYTPDFVKPPPSSNAPAPQEAPSYNTPIPSTPIPSNPTPSNTTSSLAYSTTVIVSEGDSDTTNSDAANSDGYSDSYTGSTQPQVRPLTPQTQNNDNYGIATSIATHEPVQNVLDFLSISDFNLSDAAGKWSTVKKKLFARNWNKEFQILLEMEDRKEKFSRLANLEHDFVYAALTYGRIIISEHCLPDEQKTLKPVSVGGVAGGQKYICNGILFKFSIDHHNLYGGDENAMKAAAHELKGLQNYYHCNIHGLCFPLMAFIDYRGWRLQALSLLPIGGNSLIYGSANGGRSVMKENEILNEKMKEAGIIMGLKPHMVGPEHDLRELSSCCDIEGHQGKDGRFYLLDFARVAPPEPPSVRGSNLYKLLRLEFVRNFASNGTPLSSDGFSRMGLHNYQEHCAEIQAAYDFLVNQFIPEVATNLDNDDKVRSEFIQDIPKFLHKNGINCRHLGRIRNKCQNPRIKDIVLEECIARVCKVHLRSLLRKVSRETGVPSDEPFRAVVLQFFNIIIGQHSKSEKYWKFYMKKELMEKFGLCLTEEEQSDDHVIPKQENFSYFSLFKRIFEATGVRVSPQCMKDLELSPENLEFVGPDVDLEPTITHMNIIDYADGMSLYYEALERPITMSATRDRLLNLAKDKLETSLASMANNLVALLQLGTIFQMMAKTSTSGHYKTRNAEMYERAVQIYQQVLHERIDSGLEYTAKLMYAKALFRWSTVDSSKKEESMAKLEEALDLNRDSFEALYLKAKILSSKTEEMMPVLEQCLLLLETRGVSAEKKASPLFYMGSTLISKIAQRTPETDSSEFWYTVSRAANALGQALRVREKLAQKLLKGWKTDPPISQSFSTFIVASQCPEMIPRISQLVENSQKLEMADRLIFEDEAELFVNFAKLFKQATHLSLKNIHTLPADSFIQISSQIPTLTHLNLSGTNFNLKDLPAIFEVCPNLEDVDVSGCLAVTDKMIEDVTDFILKKNIKLKNFSVANCHNLTDDTLKLISTWPELVELDASGISCSEECFRILSSCVQLEKLRMCSVKLSQAAFTDALMATLTMIDLLGTDLPKELTTDINQMCPVLSIVRHSDGLVDWIYQGDVPLELRGQETGSGNFRRLNFSFRESATNGNLLFEVTYPTQSLRINSYVSNIVFQKIIQNLRENSKEAWTVNKVIMGTNHRYQVKTKGGSQMAFELPISAPMNANTIMTIQSKTTYMKKAFSLKGTYFPANAQCTCELFNDQSQGERLARFQLQAGLWSVTINPGANVNHIMAFIGILYYISISK